MTAEAGDRQLENTESTDPYLGAVERRIGDQELSDDGVKFVADLGRDLTLLGIYGDLNSPKEIRRGRGVVNLLTVIGQKKLIDVALGQVAQQRAQSQPSHPPRKRT